MAFVLLIDIFTQFCAANALRLLLSNACVCTLPQAQEPQSLRD